MFVLFQESFLQLQVCHRYRSNSAKLQKRVQCKAKELAFLRSLPSENYFGEARVA